MRTCLDLVDTIITYPMDVINRAICFEAYLRSAKNVEDLCYRV